VPLNATAEATVYDGVLTLGAGKRANRRHERPATARAIPWHAVIHMTGMETIGTVVAVLAAKRNWPNDDLAVAAAKRLLFRARPGRSLAVAVLSVSI
jgi:hypothetical protein